jgi:L-amino acid N-acyltransferase YncA
MKPLIRPAQTSDIPAITRIYADAVTHGTASFELEAPDEPEMARRMSDLLAKGFPYIVAETGGELGGYAYAGPFRTRPAYRLTVENSVYVAPKAHRQGIGRALLQALIEASQAAGHRQMIAVIGDSTQQQPSIALHAACGFKHIGILPDTGFKHGRWLDTVLMQRAIGAGGTRKP